MSQDSLYSLIVGLIIGGLIYFVSTVIPEATLAKIVRFIAIFILVIVAVNFIFALLGFPPFLAIGNK